jgi:hypothetical protein
MSRIVAPISVAALSTTQKTIRTRKSSSPRTFIFQGLSVVVPIARNSRVIGVTASAGVRKFAIEAAAFSASTFWLFHYSDNFPPTIIGSSFSRSSRNEISPEDNVLFLGRGISGASVCSDSSS